MVVAIISADRNACLNLANHNANESADLHKLDQLLYTMEKSTYEKLPKTDETIKRHIVSYFRGQLLLHSAALLFNREIAGASRNQATNPNAMAYHCEVVNDAKQKLLCLWGAEGSFRRYQAGRTLLACIDNQSDSSKVLVECRRGAE